MNNKPKNVAIAILCSLRRSPKGEQNRLFLMQLRDDVPGILYPGHWGLFGGHIEPGETPEEGLKRELLEEINYPLQQSIKFGCYATSQVIRHVYYVPLTVEIDQLILAEGWDMRFLSPADICHGSCYSQKANQVRPLGSPHRKILLDFIKKY